MRDRTPIGDISETLGDILETLQKPTCLIRDLEILHRRPICLWRNFGDRHACGVQWEYKQIYLDILFFYFIFFIY